MAKILKRWVHFFKNGSYCCWHIYGPLNLNKDAYLLNIIKSKKIYITTFFKPVNKLSMIMGFWNKFLSNSKTNSYYFCKSM